MYWLLVFFCFAVTRKGRQLIQVGIIPVPKPGLTTQPAVAPGAVMAGTATTGITVALEIDSAGGAPVTSYRAGLPYTVKIKGVNTTANNLPKFGFQITAITGATAQATPTNAGTWAQTGLPTNVHFSAPQANNFVLNIIEHGAPLSPDSGTGSTGTVYAESINWTAPAAGTGTVSFWCALNAVNNDGQASSADKWNTQHLVLAEDTATIPTAVNSTTDVIAANIYPNPSTDFVRIELNNADPGSYLINVYDAQGRQVSSNLIEASGDFTTTTVNTSNRATGTYLLQISHGTNQKVMKVVKR